jgi:hypothetical protein
VDRLVKYRVRITGISGSTFWLDHGVEVANEESSQRFDSTAEAATAGRLHLAAIEPCVARHMSFDVLPAVNVLRVRRGQPIEQDGQNCRIEYIDEPEK